MPQTGPRIILRMAGATLLAAALAACGTASTSTPAPSASPAPTTGIPVESVPVGSEVPTPPPGAKGSPVEPTPVPHAAPDLEALLPDEIGGTALLKESHTGEEYIFLGPDPVLEQLGAQPSGLATAIGTPPLDATVPFIAQVDRVTAVSGRALLSALLETSQQLCADTQVTQTSLGGHEVTHVQNGCWLLQYIRARDVWFYDGGEVLYAAAAADEEHVVAILEALP